MNSRVPLFVAILLIAISVVTGLTCYSCEGRDNEICGRDPTRASRVTCSSNELCNVLRIERSDSFGRTVTISRGCRQSAFAGAVGGNGVGVSTTSQSCSTDLCNTGDGLGPSINFPGFNTNGFNFNSAGINTGFQHEYTRGSSAHAASMNYNLLLLPFLGLVSSILGMKV